MASSVCLALNVRIINEESLISQRDKSPRFLESKALYLFIHPYVNK